MPANCLSPRYSGHPASSAASLGLAPQSDRVLSVEIIACAGAPAAVVLAVQLRHGQDNPADPIWWYLTRIATIQIPAPLFLTGGITLAVRHGGGLYWMLPATGRLEGRPGLAVRREGGCGGGPWLER